MSADLNLMDYSKLDIESQYKIYSKLFIDLNENHSFSKIISLFEINKTLFQLQPEFLSKQFKVPK